jgi:hypothetical protein
VEIRDWLAAYCANQSIPVTTLAGIKGAGGSKYGDYTLLPRRYYAAPLTGSQPSGGIIGIATNGGAFWQDASSDIQKLVGLAKVNYELSEQPVDIWAAAGTYYKVAGDGSNSVGTVIDISGGTDYLSIYGGFTGTETAAIGSLPTDRASWFNSYATLALGNRYGTAKDAAHKTTINADGSGTTVKVGNAVNFVFDGFTITGGAQSGLRIDNAPATALFTNLEVTGNAIIGPGGGIYVGDGAPHLDKLTITNNTSTTKNAYTDGWGGGICLDSSAALVTNALVSGNEVINESGGGIAIAGASPRMENIVVTGNKSSSNGGGIYLHGTPVIVNALVSGNRMTVSISPAADLDLVGGGGIKVSDAGSLTLINSTVSGNYAFYTGRTAPRGGGIMLIRNPAYGPSTLKLYNSLVLGNIGQGGDDDLTVINSNFSASNSLMGGWSKTAMDATSGGGNNVDGIAYGVTAWDLLTKLNNGFFVKFAALPAPANTGDTGYNAVAWDFRLSSPPPGVVDGGDSAHYGLVSGGVSTDVAGASRVQSGGPDMGAYESALIGVPIPTYTVFNLKPQSASTANNGYLTVNSAAQAGAEVTVEATSSYTVGTITCRTASGTTIPVTGGSFTMPAENVTVDATFTTSSVGGQTGFGS